MIGFLIVSILLKLISNLTTYSSTTDYDKGFLTYKDIDLIGKKSKLSFIDTKKVVDHNYFKDYTFVKMNEVEWDRCVDKG